MFSVESIAVNVTVRPGFDVRQDTEVTSHRRDNRHKETIHINANLCISSRKHEVTLYRNRRKTKGFEDYQWYVTEVNLTPKCRPVRYSNSLIVNVSGQNTAYISSLTREINKVADCWHVQRGFFATSLPLDKSTDDETSHRATWDATFRLGLNFGIQSETNSDVELSKSSETCDHDEVHSTTLLTTHSYMNDTPSWELEDQRPDREHKLNGINAIQISDIDHADDKEDVYVSFTLPLQDRETFQ